MSTKSRIYKFLRIWNDVSAVKKGKIAKRIGRREEREDRQAHRTASSGKDNWTAIEKAVQVGGGKPSRGRPAARVWGTYHYSGLK